MKLFVLICIICLTSNSFAQISGEPRTFTLNECLKIASESNYEIQTAIGQYQTQSAALSQAFGAFLPSVGASMGYSRQLNVDGGRTVNIGGQVISIAGAEPNSYSINAYTSYTLFNGFSRESNYSRSRQELNAAELTLRRARQSVSYSVRSKYLAVLKAMQVTKIRRENFELGRKEAERTKALYEAGRVPIANVYSQESDLGTREIEIVSAENAENQARAQLLSTLALPPDMRAEFLESSYSPTLDDIQLADFRKEVGSYSSAVASALSSRVDYLSTESQIRAAQSGVSSANGGYLPNVAASGGWSWSNTSFDKFSDNGRAYVSMNLSVPIFDNFNTSTQVQNATIQVRQREIDRALLEQRVRTEVQSGFLNVEAAEKQLEISKRVIRSASQNYEAIKERLNVGASTVLEYQTANNQLINAKINRINAVYAFFDAQAQLRFALGTLKEKQ